MRAFSRERVFGERKLGKDLATETPSRWPVVLPTGAILLTPRRLQDRGGSGAGHGLAFARGSAV